MWMIALVSVLVAHEGHDHEEGTGGIALTMLPEALCEVQWPSMLDAPEPISRKCNGYFIPFAYPNGFDPDKPPTFGHVVETKLSADGLRQLLVHMKDTCHVDEPVEDAACFRATEFYQGMLDRKMAVKDNGAWFDLMLEQILAGNRLNDATLRRSWSVLTLNKLEYAVYARHGQPLDVPDLDAFFYAPREKPVAGLPLEKKPDATVILTDADEANLKMIRDARERNEEKKNAYGF
ncbi:MAG: hypothetical protein AAFV53_43795 [Myxococcota bacterium]